MAPGAMLAGVVLVGAGLLALAGLSARRKLSDPAQAEHPGLEVRMRRGARGRYLVTVRHIRHAPRPVWRVQAAELIGWPSARIALGAAAAPSPAAFHDRRIDVGRVLPSGPTFATEIVVVVRPAGGSPPPAGASLALRLTRGDGEVWTCRAPLALD